MPNLLIQKNTNLTHAYDENRSKDYLSHELRISLTGILGISYLLDKSQLDKSQRILMQLLHHSVERLSAAVESYIK